LALSLAELKRGIARFWRRRPTLQAIALVQLMVAASTSLWVAGGFEAVELLTFDALTQVRSALHRGGAAPVVLIGANENDLNRLGWPLSDAKLAQALDALEAMGPRVVGVDIYRDAPRPPGAEALDAALKAYENVIVTYKFADGDEASIPPPAVLRGTDRAGFGDTISDPGGTVRRGLLFLDDGRASASSLPLLLTLRYLQKEGVRLTADPGDPEAMRLGKTALRPFASNEGGYVHADDRGYQILLDFLGGPHPFPRVTLSALLAGEVPAELVRDKVVLLGVAAESVKDFFYTPFSQGTVPPRTLYGIELHGHVVAQLLRHALDGVPPLRSPPGWAGAVWIWLCGMAGGLAALRWRTPLLLTSLCAGGIMAVLGVCLAGFLAAYWLSFAPAAASWTGSVLLVTALMSKQEKHQRELLMQILSSNVSPDIADSLWQQREVFMEGGRPRPLSLVATVLFTDLRDFTSISEGFDPPELLDWLNAYMEAMANVVARYDGVIDKFIGDAIMAVFGVPVPRTGEEAIAADARRAVDCALAMAETLERLNVGWRAEGRPEVRMRVGIFTGSVVAGQLGSKQRMNYTVIGDTVNTASRLESFDKSVGADCACRIIVGAPTLSLIGDGYVVEPVGDLALKGKSQRVVAYLVRGRGSSPEEQEAA
jgi:adenylate cyclase